MVDFLCAFEGMFSCRCLVYVWCGMMFDVMLGGVVREGVIEINGMERL